MCMDLGKPTKGVAYFGKMENEGGQPLPVLIGARVLTAYTWLPKLLKNLKSDFFYISIS